MMTRSQPPLAETLTIRAQLTGSACTAVGVVATGHAPAVELCRRLLAAGLHPDLPVEVYRGSVLCLRIRSVGEGARLQVRDNRFGEPVFRRKTASPGVPPASSVRFSGSGVAETAARASAYQEGHRQ